MLVVGGNTENAVAELYEPGLPAPVSLQIIPASASMLTGDTKQFSVVDDLGQQRSDALWTVSDTSVATIPSDSSPTITAVNPGQVTLTANVDGVIAQAQITVAPHSLQITPAAATMLIGDSRQFTVVDERGRPSPIATWTVSDASLASITTDSSPVLTGVAGGQVTLTANVEGVTAQAQVTISAAAVFAPGTVVWSSPSVPGFSPLQLVQAVPTSTTIGPDLYSIQSTSDGAQTVIQASTIDGQQMWQTQLSAVNAKSVPDAFGGLVVTQFNTCDNINPIKIVKLDGTTGNVAWQVTGQSTCAPIAPQMAIRPDGSIVVASSGNTAGFPELLVLDGNSGSFVAVPSIPASTYTDSFGTTLSGFSPIGPPIVDSDGSAYVEYEVRNINAFERGGFPAAVSSVLWLLKVAPDNSTTATQLSSSSNMNLFPGALIPDGNGGIVATWTIAWTGDVTIPQPPHPYQGAHVSSIGGVVTYDMPMSLPQLVNDPSTGLPVILPLVLGENGTAFVSYGSNVTSFDLNSGAVNWNYQAPIQNFLALIASAAGNGLVAKNNDQNLVETVLRFDSTGAMTTDAWTGSRIDYWAGTTWLGMQSPGNAAVEYSAEFVQLSTASWLEENQSGTNQAVQNLSVTNFSNAGPNQAIITSVLQKLQTALPSNSSCNNWLQGSGTSQGRSGLQQIQEVLSSNLFGHGTVNRGTTPYYDNGAFSFSTNPDKTPVPGIPPGVAAFTVNDIGAFFNAADNQGRPFQVGKRGYAGNTLRAQASILLHEVAHQITVFGFQHDNGNPKAGKANDKLVNQNCRQLIEGLQ